MMNTVDEIICSRCPKEIEEERIRVIPDTRLCSQCAKIVNPPKVMGAMHFAHKTAPTIQIMSQDFYKSNWKKYNPTFGRGSGVHRMSPSRNR